MTKKREVIPRCPKRNAASDVRHFLEQALVPSSEVGADIHDAITKLLASVQRRELEQRLNELPDITGAAEAA